MTVVAFGNNTSFTHHNTPDSNIWKMAPVTTHSGKSYDEFDATLEYLQDVIDLPDWYGNALQDQEWLNEHIPHSLQQAPPQRPLDWGTGIDTSSPATIAIKFTSNKPNPAINALFTFVAGAEPPALCEDTRCTTIFGECIVADDSFAGDMRRGLRKTDPPPPSLFSIIRANKH